MTPESLSELLAELPKDRIAELKQATLELEMARMIKLIVQIQEQAPSLAQVMMAMAKNFKYEELLSLLSSR